MFLEITSNTEEAQRSTAFYFALKLVTGFVCVKINYMKYPNFNQEKKLWKRGYKYVVGLDEAGRGPLAGPVVAAAVCVNLKFGCLLPGGFIYNLKSILNDKILKNVKDSKKMTPKAREGAYKILTNHPQIKYGVGVVSEKVIDKINILQATKLAMQKAVKNLCNELHDREVHCVLDFLIIDGNFTLRQAQGKKYIPEKSIIKGDRKVFSIAAASIIAKVTRDRLMRKYHKKYPQYGFDLHKGYGTKAHFANLQKFGPCKIHRKTFRPCLTYLKIVK